MRRSRTILLSICHVALAAFLAGNGSCSLEEKPYVPRPGTSYDAETGLPLEILSTKDRAVMVLVRPGRFRRGDPAGITRALRLPAFYVDKHEVTNGRYERFVLATGHRAPSFAAPEAAGLRWETARCPAGREEHPVVLVRYEDAAAFAAWARKRLPSQAEWEYAARGPEGRAFPWGDSKLGFDACNTADRIAGRELIGHGMWETWYREWAAQPVEARNAGALRPVGSFPKDISPSGCIDMGGNVREWCVKRRNGDVTGPDAESAAFPGIVTDERVTCGGSWLREASAARAWLYEVTESSPYYDVGFRCVVPADDPAVAALARPTAGE
jgi:formylglycine-generating enzyme required for sulfatase activity